MENINVNTTIDLQMLLTLIAIMATILIAGKRGKRDEEESNNSRFTRVHSRIDKTDHNVAVLDKRTSVIESQMQGLAKHADVEALKGQMEKMQASQTRIEDFLMNNKGQ